MATTKKKKQATAEEIEKALDEIDASGVLNEPFAYEEEDFVVKEYSDESKELGEEVRISEKTVPTTDPADTTKPLHISSSNGKVTVTSQLFRLDPEIKSREIEVDVFVTQPVMVSRMYEAVVLGQDGYPRAKSSCFISWPCYREEFPEAVKAVARIAKKELAEDVKASLEKLKAQGR